MSNVEIWALQSANLGDQGLVISLGGALVITMLFNVLYLRRVWKIARLSQVTVSTVALVAYVYVTGGVFKAANIAPPFLQLSVLIIVTAFLVIFEPPEHLSAQASSSA